jgi:hypothetical protein
MPFTKIDTKILAEVTAKHPKDKPIYMLSLLRYREKATYDPPRPDLPECSGREALATRYFASLQPFYEADGTKPILVGQAYPPYVGPEGEHWDDVSIIVYPTAEAFLRMVNSEKYKKECEIHRLAGLADWRFLAIDKLEL